MDRTKFDLWVQAIGLDPQLSAAFYTSMANYQNADVVLNAAARRKMPASQMLSLLKGQGVYTEGIEAMMLTGRQASQPVSPVFARPPRGASMRPVRKPGAVVIEEETPLQPLPTKKPSFLDRFRPKKAPSDGSEAPKKGVSRTLGIVLMVVLVLILVAVGYFSFGRQGNSSYDFSYDMNGQPVVSEPAPTYDPALGFATQTPGESAPTQKAAQPDRWQQFVALNRNDNTNGPFLDKPTDWKDIFKQFPTRWFLWIVFLYPIWTLLKQDRLAAEERTDVKAAKLGLIVLFIGVLCAGLLSAGVTYLAVNIVGTSMEIPRYFFISMGIVVNLFVQWTAAMNGRKDYSTFSIGGLFFTGALLIWWFTPNLSMIVLGSLFMAGGIWLQNVEMLRTHQGWAAHMTTLAMLLLFAGITAFVYFLGGLIPVITSAMPWIQQFAYAVLYSGRLFIGAIVGLMVAFAGGDYVSTTFMLPAIAGGVSLAGSKADDDMSHKFDVNARYDAMAYAIMILYPIAAILWYAIVLL